MYFANLIKNATIAVLVSAVTFTACKKPVSETPLPQEPVLLKEFSDGTDITNITYNPDSTVKTIRLANDPVSLDDNVTYTASYNPGKKLKELNGSNGTKIKVTYTGNLLTKAEMFNGTIKYAETIYEYNGTTLKSSTISIVDNAGSMPYFKSEFTFNTAGNVTRSDVLMYDPLLDRLEPTGYVLNQYDTKKNPFIVLGDVNLIFWQVASKNNPVKQEYFDKNGVAEEVVETTYTYGALDYPVRASMKETQPGQQPVISIVTFKY
ncbi:MAG TPA: hypothetical protein VFV46_04585 [Lacibacter sp.]|nr:hypothetical protein [Lacibacter sp.]